MAITALENFSCFPADHLIANSTATMVPFGSYSGQLSALTGSTYVRDLEGGKRWVTHDRTTGSIRWYALDMAAVIKPGASRVIVGWRCRRQVVQASTNFAVFAIGSLQPSYNWPTGKTEAYFEVVLDRSDWSVQLWADGRLVNTSSITVVAERNSILAATSYFTFALSTPANFAITDVYVVEDTGDDSPNSRIGPQDITSVPLEIVVGSEVGEWDTEAIQDVLTREHHGVDTGTRVTGQGLGGSIQLKQVAGWQPPNDTAVNGVGVFIGATHKSGSPGDLGVKLTRGDHQDSVRGILNDTVPTYPNVRMINNSRSADEQKSNTAFDGFAIDLTLESR